MLHAVADKPLNDEIVTVEQWQADGIKQKQPLGQIPTYTCDEGVVVMSNSIARYVAKKFGMMVSVVLMYHTTLKELSVILSLLSRWFSVMSLLVR